MLSRVALARQGLAASRWARTTATSPLSASALRPAAASLSPWIRTYAKNRSNKQLNNSQKQQGAASSSPSPPQEPPLSEPASLDAKPANKPSRPSPSQPRQDDVAAAEKNDAPEAPKEGEPIPFHKLPDLTQGIPSTLESEMETPSEKSQSSLQNVDPSEQRERRDRSDSYIPTSERNRKWWTRAMLLGAGVSTVAGIMWLGRGWELDEAERHPDIPNGWSPSLWLQRVQARWAESKAYYQDPEFDKLLPDPDPSFARPYTLCISLDDLLVHSEWSREHGWRLAKRPGVDYFIRYLSQYYELVLFTTVPFAMGEPLVQKLDPFRFIMWPLFREATKFEDGEIVKDLSYLNRDLSKVMILDTNATHVRKQPENAIVLDPWKGDPSDKELVNLIPFLEYIHTMQYDDVRKVIKSFDGKHIPSEFSRREAIARREFNAQRAANQGRHSKPSGVGALGSMLGLNPSNLSMTVAAEGEPNPTEAFAQGKMLQDIARERGQRNYEMLEKEIRENGEMWLKEQKDAMDKANAEAMSTMVGSMGTWFTPKKDGE